MKPLYIIPARGGSKGIPRKNIKELNGKPLIAYSIDIAKAMGDGYVLVSTEDDEIAEVAKKCGIEVSYKRPDILATDTAGSREVLLDAMDWADRQGIAYDCVVLLQPTSPFRTIDDLKECMSLYHEGIDMAVGVTEASSNPYYNCYEIDSESDCLRISKGDGNYKRRQDAPKAYEINGVVYVINPESLRKMNIGDFPKRIPYMMPKDRSLDLDTPLDWIIAETLMKNNG